MNRRSYVLISYCSLLMGFTQYFRQRYLLSFLILAIAVVICLKNRRSGHPFRISSLILILFDILIVISRQVDIYEGAMIAIAIGVSYWLGNYKCSVNLMYLCLFLGFGSIALFALNSYFGYSCRYYFTEYGYLLGSLWIPELMIMMENRTSPTHSKAVI